MERSELALKNYKRAVELQPGYTTAWNNLGDAYEKARDWDQVMPARNLGCVQADSGLAQQDAFPGETDISAMTA